MWDFVLRPILTVLLLGIAALGVGNWIAPWLSPAFNRFDRIVFSWLGGIGSLSLILFLIGQWRFSRTTVGTVVFISLLFAGKPLVVLFQEFRDGRRRRKRLTIPKLIVWSLLSLIAFGSLAEITGDWTIDAVVYHLLGPKVWIREGIIRPVPDN